MVQVVSPLVKYSDFVSTTRVTLHEVRQMAATIAQNKRQNAVSVIKCFFILQGFSVLRREKAAGQSRDFDIRYLMCSATEPFPNSQYKVNKLIQFVQVFTNKNV